MGVNDEEGLDIRDGIGGSEMEPDPWANTSLITAWLTCVSAGDDGDEVAVFRHLWGESP